MLEYLCNISNRNDINLSVKPIFLLVNSMHDNYNCSDVLVRLLAIDCYYGKNDYGFKIYNEMQEKRVLKNPNVPNERAYNQKRFEELIRSFEMNGFKNEYPLQVNKELEFLDGSHRLALSLYYHIETVPIYFSESRLNRKVDYSLEWFKSEGMGQYETIILDKYKNILDEYKENFLVVVNGNLKEIEFYEEKFLLNDEVMIQNIIKLNVDKLKLLNKQYDFLGDTDFDINKEVYGFEVKVNYKIRAVEVVNDKRKVVYNEFISNDIPCVVLSKKEIINQILKIGVDRCE